MSNPINRFSQPGVDVRDRPEKVAAWIMWNVPSFNGIIPYQWTAAVYREAARWNISPSTVAAALVIARKHGHNFPTATIAGNRRSEPEIKAISKEETTHKIKYSLELLDARLRVAEATNNTAAMEQIVALALKLLWDYAKAHAQARKNRTPDAVLEWQDINRAVNEATRRAQSLDSHFRTLTRQELTELKDMGPGLGLSVPPVPRRIAQQSLRRRSRPVTK